MPHAEVLNLSEAIVRSANPVNAHALDLLNAGRTHSKVVAHATFPDWV